MIVANLPEFSFPHEAAIQINLPVLIFCIVVAVGTGILFGSMAGMAAFAP